MPCTVRPSTPEDMPYIDSSYRSVDFAAVEPDQLVLVAEEEGARRGLGRLIPIGANAVELGGIFVEPAARRHGVAEAIVRALLARAAGRRVYCVPFARLVDYYKRFGFVDCAMDGSEPAGIRSKLRYCQGRYPDTVAVLVMP